ncbi:MAG TPA: UDP-3-O-acyl-N-acetylglucosamine deacetylase, partial [Longimicrobium sp.]|nr:UDP-3-O-acyl-N-acetylglucosamine deacetylase [Longimicrobium sp.]
MPTTPRQNTIAREGHAEGVGLHTGAPVHMRILPAPVNTGIVFRRTDLDGSPEIPAHVSHVVGTDLGTTIGIGEARVHTVEHFLAAAMGRGIDNAYV